MLVVKLGSLKYFMGKDRFYDNYAHNLTPSILNFYEGKQLVLDLMDIQCILIYIIKTGRRHKYVIDLFEIPRFIF